MSGKPPPSLSNAALEHIMRDVLSGLEDLCNRAELERLASDMEIVCIHPAGGETASDTGAQDANRHPAGSHRAPALRLLQ